MTIIVILVICFIIVVIIYNQLIRSSNLMQEALSAVDVQLKRRYNLIPNLVAVVKGYKDYEENILPAVTKLRSQPVNTQTLGEKGKLESGLSKQIKTIFALSESYPDLKANQNFLELQNSLIEVEDQIQLSRRYFNGTVRDYNIQVTSFPQILIALIFKFERAEFFELEYATERKTPDVNFKQ